MFKVVTIKTFKNQKLIFVQVKRLQNSFCTKIAKRFPVYKPGTALAGVVGFEPTECWNQNPVPYQLGYSPIYGGLKWTCTTDTEIFSLLLYYLSYQAIFGGVSVNRTQS